MIRALEAGSAAGGDKRCNRDGSQQTALSAFIAVVEADQAPFAAPFSTSAELDRTNTPWVYFSVIEEEGGPNPIIALRQGYDIWRAESLPPCPTCDLRPIKVPPGGAPQESALSEPVEEQPQIVDPTPLSPRPTAAVADPPAPIGEGSESSSPASFEGIGPFLILFVLLTVVLIVFLLIRRARAT